MSFVSNVLIPVIKILLYVGFFGFLSFVLIKALWNGWSKKYKFVFRFKILKKPYPVPVVNWCIENLNEGVGYYQVKKFLMIKNRPQSEINEMLWIYQELVKELKGGIDKNGRQFEGVGRKVEVKQDLPIYSEQDIPRD